jgi:hypothetical protein
MFAENRGLQLLVEPVADENGDATRHRERREMYFD